MFNGASTPTNPPPTPSYGDQITGAALWPLQALDGIVYPSSGYSSGGALAAAVLAPHSGFGFPTFGTWFISYFGINDAATVTNPVVFPVPSAAGIQLQFNGVPYTAANVEGPGATGFPAQYTYWGYEHVFYRTNYSGYGKTVADQIVSDLTTTSASVSGILLSDMRVSRDRDGGPIEPVEAGGNP